MKIKLCGGEKRILNKLIKSLRINMDQAQNKNYKLQTNKGFSLVEAILASSIFALLVSALVGAWLYGQESAVLAGNRVRALFFAEEGLAAVQNIRDADFEELADGTHGIMVSENQWILSGSSDTNGIFTRQIEISSVDDDRKRITSTITWQQNPQRSGSVSAVTYLTNWQTGIPLTASCNEHALQSGYISGTCRQNINQCTNNGEEYLPTGDEFCTGPSANTCCALPQTSTPPVASCNEHALQSGYISGTCRQNTRQCERNGEEYLPTGDEFCTGPSANTCCALP